MCSKYLNNNINRRKLYIVFQHVKIIQKLHEYAISCFVPFFLQMMFFTMLVMYSAFVLTSIHTTYYVQDIARIFEYYVYFWGAGDFIEELISCFVGQHKRWILHNLLLHILDVIMFVS